MAKQKKIQEKIFLFCPYNPQRNILAYACVAQCELGFKLS